MRQGIKKTKKGDKMKPRNNPTNKYFSIDGQILQVVKATPCTEEADGLPLWNVEFSNGLQLGEWYPEHEVGKDKPIDTEALDARFDLVQLIANATRDYIKESHKDDINDYDLDYSFILCENSKEIDELCEKVARSKK